MTLDLHYNLLEQFQRFADGRRSDYIMSPLVKQFGVDDKITLVTCYRAQARRNDYQRPEDPSLVIRGQGLYEKICTNCHGSDSRGKQGYTYIAGQPIKYVARTLFHFREKTGGRTNPLMEAVASRLSSDDVDASSAFIFSLR